jgi:tripartite-type tricarboxylate transporter receptor subunit TctC
MIRKIGTALALLVLSGAAAAQSFPSRPIRFMVGYPPGGGSDVSARVVAAAMEQRLGQPVIVENKPGANGLIGAQYVLQSAADGYTLHFGGVTNLSSVFQGANGLDASKVFEPISALQVGAFVIAARTDTPYNTYQELVAYSKANPGKVNFGGAGSTSDLLLAVLRVRTGLNVMPILYKGDSQVIAAVLGGDVQLVSSNTLTVLPQVAAGRLKPLFTTRSRRSALLPNVPTAEEAGAQGVVLEFNLGLWAPKGTPQPVIQRLNTEAVASVRQPDVIEQFHKFGADATGTTPEELLHSYDVDMRFMQEAARLANFKP